MRKLIDYRNYSQRGMEIDRNRLNCVAIFQAESYKHFVAKSCLVYLLRKMGHDVATEVPIPGLGVGDVIDLTTSTQYEIELTNAKAVRESKLVMYRRTGVNIIVVDCSKMPDNVSDIAEFLDPYITVD